MYVLYINIYICMYMYIYIYIYIYINETMKDDCTIKDST